MHSRGPRGLIALALLFGAKLAFSGTPLSEPNTIPCVLDGAGTEFTGACEIPCLVHALKINIDGPIPGVACAAPPRRVTATLRQIQGRNWLGTMEGAQAEDPTGFDVILGRDGKPGLAKTPFGWFRLEAARLENGRLNLVILGNKQLPPTADDIRIIHRAIASPQKWSAFWALMQATQEVSGGVHYRQPALQAVREIVNEVGGTRVNKHRLMDYNNHPDTTLDDIHNMLRAAQTRLERRMR